jgi:hypothetical protein
MKTSGPERLRRYRLVPVALLLVATPVVADEDPRLEQSREIVKAFAGQLMGELQTAMAAGGPAAAIDVCKDVAPAVASRLSREYGAKVGRTSLRFRNPANLPGRWETAVLEDFDARAAEAADAPLEFFEERRNGRFRYMRAIPAGGVCLACHGEAVSDEVQRILDAEYPHDRARGYAAGDIRGAFSIVWPAQDDPGNERPRQ